MVGRCSLFFSYFCLSSTVRVSCSNPTIWELSHPRAIREQNIFLPIGEFDGLNSRFFDSLNGAVRENTLLFPVLKNALNRTIREYDLFCTIREMFFNLLIRKFENLKPILIRSLRGLCLSEVVHNSAVWECLFDILICKEDNQIAIWICLTTHPIRKDDFFLP